MGDSKLLSFADSLIKTESLNTVIWIVAGKRAIEDSDGYISQIREALSGKPKGNPEDGSSSTENSAKPNSAAQDSNTDSGIDIKLNADDNIKRKRKEEHINQSDRVKTDEKHKSDTKDVDAEVEEEKQANRGAWADFLYRMYQILYQVWYVQDRFIVLMYTDKSCHTNMLCSECKSI